ncbi:MAG: serine hydrolase domain-containing protein [Thermoanaerobaculia bacterium]|nr:serine hydrolase domain-containing protein [Thermoanaerobaculia bacterium]
MTTHRRPTAPSALALHLSAARLPIAAALLLPAVLLLAAGAAAGSPPRHGPLASPRAATGITTNGAAAFDREAIDAVVEQRMEEQRIPGVAVAVVRGEEVLLAAGYGVADLEHDVPVTPRTMFQSGSVGKMFTAAAVMLLVEDGRLDLDASVRRYLPEVPASWEPITLRHLLTHTSGVPDYTSDTLDYTRQYTEEDLVRLASELELEFPAGSRWNYSNTGYALLGFVVGRVAERPYWELLRERLWDPAGIPTMRVNFAADVVPHRAAGYELEDEELRNQGWVAPFLNSTADGSLLMSLEDLIAWNRVVRRRSVLRPESWGAMLSPVELASGNIYPYGFGWAVTTRGDHRVLAHGGGWQGFRTHFLRFPDEDLTVVVLANSAEADAGDIAEAVAAAVDPSLAPPAPPDTPIDDPSPETTAFVAEMLEKAAGPGLELGDFAFVRQTSFPWIRDALAERLAGLGTPDRLELLERRQVGDDTVMTYRAVYGERTFRVRAAVAPDGGLTQLMVRAEETD